jgi:hypothetical protein
VNPGSRSIAILLTLLGACSSESPKQPVPPAPIAAPVSFDGTYRGKIRVSSRAPEMRGAQSNWCNTPSAISLSVQNSGFSYVLAHPNLPKDPGLSPTIAVTIAPDGSFKGSNANGGTDMVGRITGLQMEGQIKGLGCGYTFTAERS